jgi:ribosomal protein S18 acetylase RimI-like enzyme
MNQDSFENRKSGQEKPDVRIEIATEKDWEVYRDLRLEAIDSADAEMLGFTPGERESEEKKITEKKKTEADWRKDLSNPDIFISLSLEGADVVGMGSARKREKEKDWYMGSGYIKKNFRGRGIGEKMFAARLNEIRIRSGEKVTIGVKASNARSIHIAELFGFKKVKSYSSILGFSMELKDVNDPVVIDKISEILHAG